MVNLKPDTKSKFDELQPDDLTQDEFIAELLETYENADEPVDIDTDEIVEEISHKTASKVELAAYRGVSEALEQ